GVDTQRSPGPHTSTVHGSPSSHAAPPVQVAAGGATVAPPVMWIGSLRATTASRFDSGFGVRSRSSYQPVSSPGGGVRTACASDQPCVVRAATWSEPPPYEPSV